MKQETCQLLTPTDDPEIAVACLRNDNYAAQQKFDGKRILLSVDRNSATAHNRNGLRCAVSPTVLEQARRLAPIAPLVLDGEWLRETKSFHAFDLLEIDGTDLRTYPFQDRQSRLSRTLAVAQLPHIKPVRTEYDHDQKSRSLRKNSCPQPGRCRLKSCQLAVQSWPPARSIQN